MDRRDFLYQSLSSAGFILLSSCSSQKRTNTVDAPALFLNGHGHEKSVSKNGYAQNYCSDGKIYVSKIHGEHYTIDTPCKGHEVSVHPLNHNLIFSTSKWGEEAFLLDLSKRRLQPVIAESGHLFYGHNFFSTDGRLVMSTMTDESTRQGYISIRETSSLKEIRRIKTFGERPHQARWFKEDQIVAVINSHKNKNAPNNCSLLNLVDFSTGNLIRSFPMTVPNYSHFSLDHHNNLATVFRVASEGKERLYESINLENGAQSVSLEFEIPKAPPVESLSHTLLVNESIAIVTVTGLFELLIWDYKKNEILNIIKTDEIPKGIAHNLQRNELYVSLSGINSNTLNTYELKSFLMGQKRILHSNHIGNGSHLTVI